MRFSEADAPQKNQVSFGVDKGQAAVVLHLETVDPRRPVPAELLSGFDDRKARQPHPTLGGTSASQIGLACQQGGEGVKVRPRLLGRERGEFRRLPSDTGAFEGAEMVLHIAQ
jgi:hypothetical protein